MSTNTEITISTKDSLEIEKAVALLESPNLAIKVADIIGTPIEKAISLLPAKATEMISKAAQKAVQASLSAALKTMDHHDPKSGKASPDASDWWHIAASAATGAAGGLFGISALLIELPVSTTIIMRSIADIARSEGADLNEPQTQLECVQVLALGGESSSDDSADIGYFAAREALAKAVADAAAYVAQKGVEKEGAPAIVRLILAIAERYSITVTEKAAAQAVPIIGAAGGAVINSIFISYYQDVARGHFSIRRLENKYGQDAVRQKYAEIRGKLKSK